MTPVPLRDIKRFNKSRDTRGFPATALTSISDCCCQRVGQSGEISHGISEQESEREKLYLLSMFTTVALAIGYYNRHIHSGDGDTTHKNTIEL